MPYGSGDSGSGSDSGEERKYRENKRIKRESLKGGPLDFAANPRYYINTNSYRRETQHPRDPQEGSSRGGLTKSQQEKLQEQERKDAKLAQRLQRTEYRTSGSSYYYNSDADDLPNSDEDSEKPSSRASSREPRSGKGKAPARGERHSGQSDQRSDISMSDGSLSSEESDQRSDISMPDGSLSSEEKDVSGEPTEENKNMARNLIANIQERQTFLKLRRQAIPDQAWNAEEQGQLVDFLSETLRRETLRNARIRQRTSKAASDDISSTVYEMLTDWHQLKAFANKCEKWVQDQMWQQGKQGKLGAYLHFLLSGAQPSDSVQNRVYALLSDRNELGRFLGRQELEIRQQGQEAEECGQLDNFLYELFLDHQKRRKQDLGKLVSRSASSSREASNSTGDRSGELGNVDESLLQQARDMLENAKRPPEKRARNQKQTNALRQLTVFLIKLPGGLITANERCNQDGSLEKYIAECLAKKYSIPEKEEFYLADERYLDRVKDLLGDNGAEGKRKYKNMKPYEKKETKEHEKYDPRKDNECTEGRKILNRLKKGDRKKRNPDQVFAFKQLIIFLKKLPGGIGKAEERFEKDGSLEKYITEMINEGYQLPSQEVVERQQPPTRWDEDSVKRLFSDDEGGCARQNRDKELQAAKKRYKEKRDAREKQEGVDEK